jgi:predicted acyl esterase
MWKSEARDGMRIDWDVDIPMDDGVAMRADVFRPDDDGRYPVILSYGPYAKGLAFQEIYHDQWNRMIENHPDVAAGSSNKYQNWEVVDPEKWVPEGYACVRVDSRGTGMSPGYIDHFSPRETGDLYDCIEWAAAQDWSNGKIGLNGISYYAINQWHVASLQPPHLAAMCVWEGAADWYRDMTYHGGILSTFWENWYPIQVTAVQYGLGDRGYQSRVTGRNVSGEETLSEEELAANRCVLGDEIAAHPMDDEYHRDRSPVFEKIVTPLLSAGNWGGQGLHLRGNVEGFYQSASTHKWLELHGLEHWSHFYTDYGREIQLAFFDHFLKGEDNGWAERKPVQLQVRHVDHFEERFEDAWPIPRTEWTTFHIHADGTLDRMPPTDDSTVDFSATGDGVTFRSAPLDHETEFTGPLAARLWVSSTTEDADLFVVFRVFGPDGAEIVFQGAVEPNAPIAQGWLRASHRALDGELTEPWRPVHTHTNRQLLTAGEVYELHVELWPTSIVVPAGYTLGFSVRGTDYVYEGEADESVTEIASFANRFTGCGPFIHVDERNRPPDVFGGTTTLHIGPDTPAHVLTPLVA